MCVRVCVLMEWIIIAERGGNVGVGGCWLAVGLSLLYSYLPLAGINLIYSTHPCGKFNRKRTMLLTVLN